MDKRSFSGISSFYFKRYAFRQPVLVPAPRPDLHTIVVIPCHREPALLDTLNSLKACSPTRRSLEVWVILNQSENAASETQRQQQETLEKLQPWIAEHSTEKRSFFSWEENALPAKHAGVGLARKAGMDIALGRFQHLDRGNGSIVCLDADCTVSKNYLATMEEQFGLQEQTGFATIPFEHTLDSFDAHENKLWEGIVRYELFLRYYIQALRYSGYPFAFHTVGSSMAVKAEAYARHRGMNRRKAGEDFYFLHELAPHERQVQVSQATVYPSPRLSDRVPFGTGKAQNDWLQGKAAHQAVYHPQIFQDLKKWLEEKDRLYREYTSFSSSQGWQNLFPKTVGLFLEQNGFEKQLQAMLANTASLAAFQKQFFLWLDGFRTLKFVHFCHQTHYPALALEDALPLLFAQSGSRPPADNSLEGWLHHLRELDRGV